MWKCEVAIPKAKRGWQQIVCVKNLYLLHSYFTNLLGTRFFCDFAKPKKLLFRIPRNTSNVQAQYVVKRVCENRFYTLVAKNTPFQLSNTLNSELQENYFYDTYRYNTHQNFLHRIREYFKHDDEINDSVWPCVTLSTLKYDGYDSNASGRCVNHNGFVHIFTINSNLNYK